MKDLYKTLGVAENSDDAAIKKAYRKLAKEYHPDVTGNDKKKTERFKEINEAYAVLGDSQKRSEYDRLKHAPVRPDGMPEGFDPDAFARTFGGARGPPCFPCRKAWGLDAEVWPFWNPPFANTFANSEGPPNRRAHQIR